MGIDEDLADATGPADEPVVAGQAAPIVRRARAWLSRAAEPGSPEFWRFVEALGPVEAVRRIRGGTAPERIRALVGVRAREDGSLNDLRNAERCGGRLVVPEDDEWPAFPLHSLTLAVAEEPAEQGHRSDRTRALVPPVALWVRGPERLDELADR